MENQNLPPEAWAIIATVVTAVIGWITRYFEKGNLEKKARRNAREAYEEGLTMGKKQN
jgi:hypothetical protein